MQRERQDSLEPNMRNGTRKTEHPETPYYALSIDMYVALQHTREELRLLGRLAEPRSEDDRDEVVVSTEALSDCFLRIAEQLDSALADARRVSA